MAEETSFIIENKDQPEHRLELSLQDDAEKSLLVASPKGRIDIFTYRDMYKKLDEILGNRPRLTVVVDFSKITFVASSGWFVFVTLRARLKRNSGALAFVGLAEDMARVYKAMKMDELVPAFDSLEAAVAGVAQP